MLICGDTGWIRLAHESPSFSQLGIPTHHRKLGLTGRGTVEGTGLGDSAGKNWS